MSSVACTDGSSVFSGHLKRRVVRKCRWPSIVPGASGMASVITSRMDLARMRIFEHAFSSSAGLGTPGRLPRTRPS
eukprot:scaffold1877_cov140-Isochrysis_galbana.AAC.1